MCSQLCSGVVIYDHRAYISNTKAEGFNVADYKLATTQKDGI